jgi:GNAT superfamily N-acetyltransferase
MNAGTVRVRSATPADVEDVFRLIEALASYERLAAEVTGTAAQLREHLFGTRRYAEALVATLDDRTVGFALFFHNYSTFRTAPGLYLEDLFVEPASRRRGIGTALLAHVARLAVERGCARLEWAVLDWNAPALAFYARQEAAVLSDWRLCRMTGEGLGRLAARAARPVKPA